MSLRRVTSLVLLSVAGAFGLAFLAISRDPHFDQQLALTFGLLFFVVEQFPIVPSASSSYSVSVSFVITIAVTVAAGPGEAAVASAFGALTLRDIGRTTFTKLVFNMSQLVLTAGLGALAYTGLGGPVGRVSDAFPGVITPLIAATAVNLALNTGLVSAAVGMTESRSVLRIWLEQLKSAPYAYTAFAWLGLLLASLYLQMGWASVLFLLVPLLVARNAFQASVKMQDAYDATVRALMAAIEAKDPYTRGHAGRVAELSEMVAAEYGLTKDLQRQVRYAALMHDVGKLVVDSKVLKKPGKFTPDEYEHMKIHPIRGHVILDGIDLLQGVIDGVRHHHERMDGAGYPDGIAGEAIPLSARLIMVADAFDSMTSTRSYRPPMTIERALDELRRCAGTQFDSEAVKALETAISKRGWQPQPEPRPGSESRPETGSPLPRTSSNRGGGSRAATS